MIPFGNQTVTLLHKSATGYTRHILAGCSWRQAKIRSVSTDVQDTALETKCRIPHTQKKPEPGDLMILGTAVTNANSEIELVRLMDSLREQGKSVFMVQQVKDNSIGAPLPHYAVSGE